MSRRVKKDEVQPSVQQSKVGRSRKAIENTAVFGLILVAVGLFAPFTDLANVDMMRGFKWVYSAGALIFTVARIVGSSDPDEGMRIRRLRRLEFWAGVAFCFGVFFWFYNESKYGIYLDLGMGTMSCIRDTVYFTLAGGAIQIMAVILMARRRQGKKGDR